MSGFQKGVILPPRDTLATSRETFLVVETGVRRCHLVPYSHFMGGGQQCYRTSYGTQDMVYSKELGSQNTVVLGEEP